MNFPLLIVEWSDHTADSRWKSIEEVSQSEPAICTTIGWLIHENRESIKLCNSIIPEASGDTVGGESLILKKNIVSRYELDIV